MITPKAFLGIPMIVSDRLRGGIPTHDIVDGQQVETGRIHVIEADDQFFVSQEFLDYMKTKNNES